VSQVHARLPAAGECWVSGPGAAAAGLPELDSTIAALAGEPLQQGESHAPTLDDRALYIYTSGTTGLP
jgi:fatty-acyl-CoA synthase